MTQFSVPLAYLDGKKIGRIAEDELLRLTDDLVVDCVMNRE
jgi:hypothetical protein